MKIRIFKSAGKRIEGDLVNVALPKRDNAENKSFSIEQLELEKKDITRKIFSGIKTWII